MSKPATGCNQHLSLLNRKHPPKRLFDYLPKGRRMIVKDPLVAGGHRVLIPGELGPNKSPGYIPEHL
jgi:hypothetical protein